MVDCMTICREFYVLQLDYELQVSFGADLHKKSLHEIRLDFWGNL